jgi:hypothetical protein
VNHPITLGNALPEHVPVEHAADGERKPTVVRPVTNVVELPGGEIVKNVYMVALLNEPIGQMAADKSRSTSDEVLHACKC